MILERMNFHSDLDLNVQYSQGRTQEFIQSGHTFFILPRGGGSQHPLGPKKPWKLSILLIQRGGLSHHRSSPPVYASIRLYFEYIELYRYINVCRNMQFVKSGYFTHNQILIKTETK